MVHLQIRKKKSPPINVGVYEEFSAFDDAMEWLETYGGGKYFVKPFSLGKCKLGYSELHNHPQVMKCRVVYQAKIGLSYEQTA
jgi:hypothetical protein